MTGSKTQKKAVCCASKKNTELRFENATGKRDVEKVFHARLPAQVPEHFPVASKGRSVKDAVPGQEDGKDVVTQDEMQPPKANGGMQILDTWSLTLTSPSSTTSISPSTTSTCVREDAAKSSG